MEDSLLLCEPKYFSINYQINPWMNVNNNSNHEKAMDQWVKLYSTLSEFCNIQLIDPQPDLPDMVFTANAGLLLEKTNQVLLSKFKFQERSKEEFWFKNWFESNGYEIVNPNCEFEGAGDALYLNEKLIIAHGFRSAENAYTDDVIQVKLVDYRFYHLDTCFCPLKNGDFLIFPKAFDVLSFEKIKSVGGRMIEVFESEAVKFACNSVLVGENTVMIPENCQMTVKALKDLGYHVYEHDMSEFLKSGGACKCLTLKL